jgi:uncharacterized membrane protein
MGSSCFLTALKGHFNFYHSINNHAGIIKRKPVFAAIAYIFGLLIAVIMFLVKKEDKYVAYHAAQAICLHDNLVCITCSGLHNPRNKGCVWLEGMYWLKVQTAIYRKFC